MKTGARRLIKQAANRAGYDIVPARLSASTPSIMAKTIPLAGQISTVIDIGASNGMWTREVRPRLPLANYLMFEANEAWHDALRQYVDSDLKLHAEYVAASDHEGEIYFSVDPDNPLGGGASVEPLVHHNASLPCLPIDEAIARRGLQGPFFLKTDTQGHELEVLAGAKHVVENAALIVMEVYGIDSPGRPTFDEICVHMRDLGFRCAGIADVMTRPLDGMFWQADMHFLPSSHPAFARPAYDLWPK